MNIPILSVKIEQERDLVAARGRARQVAQLLGFDRQDQTRIATALSEIVRNAYSYGGGGKVDFEVAGSSPEQYLLIRVRDHGPGIAELKRILMGDYRSPTGMGIGITGTRRLMDQFAIDSSPGEGTTVTLGKILPKRTQGLTPQKLVELLADLARQSEKDTFGELQQQNQELLDALSELQQRQEELTRLNHELEDTNRGVVALYAELDEKAEHLRRADDLKSRFLSNMSHEFRTPLNSILALSRLLIDRADGDLTTEQERQVGFIRKGAESLYELVNDLLDLAKVESGKTEVHPAEFQVTDLFGALRGMLRPLLQNESVNLLFEESPDVGSIVSDEGKVAQILRNLVSNALKFTDKGEVRVSIRLDPVSDNVLFMVSDTGIGIPEEHRENIFQEFTQVQNPLQSRVKGTGLGLPLSKKLAELLGGTIVVESEVGAGSTFFLSIPRIYRPQTRKAESDGYLKLDESVGPSGRPHDKHVLLVDDEEPARYLARRMFLNTRYGVTEATGGKEGLQRAIEDRPDIIVLDLMMPDMTGFQVIEELKANPVTRLIPVVIMTSKVLEPAERQWLQERATAVLSKGNGEPSPLLATVESILSNFSLK